jgi:hypothetical protein
MKALKVMGTIDDRGNLALDHPLITDRNSRVEVIVLIPELLEIEEDGESKSALLQDFRQAWHEAMTGQTIPINHIPDDRFHPVTPAKTQPNRRHFPIPELAGKATTVGDIVSPIVDEGGWECLTSNSKDTEDADD